MMDDGEVGYKHSQRLKKSGVICATSRMPRSRSINLPQTCANSALAVPAASRAGSAGQIVVLSCSAALLTQ